MGTLIHRPSISIDKGSKQNTLMPRGAYSDFKARPEDFYVSENDIAASISRESFYDFVQEFWSVIIADTPVWNWHIEYLCSELQLVAENLFLKRPKLHDLVINIPPGTTKSTIISVMFPAWTWTRAPWIRTIGASATANLSLDLSKKTRDIVKSGKYLGLFPEVEISDDQDAKGYFANTKKGYRYATSTGSKFIGFHGHILIADDLINPSSAESIAECPAACQWNRSTLLQRKTDKERTIYINVAQRLSQMDPPQDFLNMAKDTGLRVKHICLPAIITADVKPKELTSRYVNGYLDPIRLNPSVLKENEVVLTPSVYAGQYLQNPVPSGGLIFDTSKFQVGRPPDKFEELVRYWDKAGSELTGCYTVGILMGRVDNTLLLPDGKTIVLPTYWILDVQRFQKEAFGREKHIKETAASDGPRVKVFIEQEPGSSGKDMAKYTIMNLSGYRVRSDKVSGSKEVRATMFASQVNAGNVWLKQGALWIPILLDEYKYFPKGTYADQVDSGSGAFRYLRPKRKAGPL